MTGRRRTQGQGIESMAVTEQRRQRQRNDRLAGVIPVPEGRGLCTACGGHIILRADGRLRSHRYDGMLCPGGALYIDHYDRQTPCPYCGVYIKGTEQSLRMHVQRDSSCPGPS